MNYPREDRRDQASEGPMTGFLMGQLAALFFALPSAAILWFATNKHLALWGPTGALMGATGFWLVLGFFAFVSIFLPKLFPSLLGKVWHALIRLEQWF